MVSPGKTISDKGSPAARPVHNGAFCSLRARFLASLHKIHCIELTFEILFSIKLIKDGLNTLFIAKTLALNFIKSN